MRANRIQRIAGTALLVGLGIVVLNSALWLLYRDSRRGLEAELARRLENVVAVLAELVDPGSVRARPASRHQSARHPPMRPLPIRCARCCGTSPTPPTSPTFASMTRRAWASSKSRGLGRDRRARGARSVGRRGGAHRLDGARRAVRIRRRVLDGRLRAGARCDAASRAAWWRSKPTRASSPPLRACASRWSAPRS